MTVATSCPSRRQLEQLMSGQLPFAEVENLARHIEACSSCVHTLNGLGEDDTLAELLRSPAIAGGKSLDDALKILIERLRGLHKVVTDIGGAYAEASREDFDFLAPPQGPGELGRLGGYRITRVLGVGGMGVVFEAEDPQLKRKVALKAMKPMLAASETAKQRFVREAQSTAAIKHDHIVTIYQVGEDRGVPFLAMEFLEGAALDAWLNNGRQPTPAQILRIGREMARGLAAAHQRGLIHRDIKPANIWLEAPQGRVKILDFGLARGTRDNTQLTQSGAIVGTPAYMSPEQANGLKVDHRTDLFSLGCVLYRLSTLQMPFKNETTMGTLMCVVTEHPPRVHEVNPAMPRALSDLVAQLMSKDPADRPASARSVVEAIQAIERGQHVTPVADKQPGAPRGLLDPAGAAPSVTAPLRSRRWPPSLVATFVAVPFLLFAIGAVIYIQTDKGTLEIQTVDDNVRVRIEQNGQLVIVVDKTTGTVVKLHSGEYQLRLGEDNPNIELDKKTIRITRGGQEVAHIQMTPEGAARARVGNNLKQIGEAAHKMHQELRQFGEHADWIFNVAFTPDGQSFVSSSIDGSVRLWDLTSGKPTRTFKGHTGHVWGLAVSRDGHRLLTSTSVGDEVGKVRLWHVDSGQELRRLQGSELGSPTVAFSPDGRYALSGNVDHSLTLWEVADGKKIRTFLGHTRQVRSVVFSPDGRHVLSGSFDRTMRLWDVETGKEVQRFVGHEAEVHSVAFSPSGDRVLSGSWDRTMRLWALNTGRELRRFKGHSSSILSAAFSPDGRLAVSADFDGGIQLWDVETGKQIHRFDGHVGPVERAVFSPNGRFILSGGKDGTLRLWQVPDAGLRPESAPAGKSVNEGWIKEVQKLPAKEQVDAVAKKLQELNPGFGGLVTPTIENGTVTGLRFVTDQVEDLSPVRALTDLEQLYCLASAPGKGKLGDLAPLKGLRLRELGCNGNPHIDDLSALSGMPLKYLFMSDTQVRDLTPLKGMPLEILHFWDVPARDLAILPNLRIKQLQLRVRVERDATILRSIKTLEKINGKPAAEFLKQFDARNAAFEQWIKDTQKLPAKEQVDAVAEKLQELNPGFDGKVTHKILDGKVRSLWLCSDQVTDIRPVAALQDLYELGCNGSGAGHGRLADLGPIRNLRLTILNCGWNPRIKDLTPLRNMPLQGLLIGDTAVIDLSPLQGLPLRELHCDVKSDRDVEILRALARKTLLTIKDRPAAEFLKQFDAQNAAFEQWVKETQKLPAQKQVDAVAKKLQERNPGFDGTVKAKIENGVVKELSFLTDHVADISPVRALSDLERLTCKGSRSGKGKLRDLSPLLGMDKLISLACAANPGLSDLRPLRDLPLKELWCFFTAVEDLSPLRGMTSLTLLEVYGTPVLDLTPLQGLRLTYLNFGDTQVSELEPLRGMPLRILILYGTNVRDLGPLKGMTTVTTFNCIRTGVSDLAPLTGMKLKHFNGGATKITDFSVLRDMPLNEVLFDIDPQRDAAILRAIKTLETINEKPAAEFWKELDKRQTNLGVWIKETQKLSPDKQVEAVAAKLKELNPGFDGDVTFKSSSNGKSIVEIQFCTDAVTDISPVLALAPGLEGLFVNGSAPRKGRLVDLSPVRRLPALVALAAHSNPISDLKQLDGVGVRHLYLTDVKVSDLTPLRGLPHLTTLHFSSNQVVDLQCLRDLRLQHLWLEEFDKPLTPEVKLLVRSLWLEGMNQPASEFWKKHDPKQAAFLQWIEATQKLQGEKQVEAVTAKLKELNSEWDGKVTPLIDQSGRVRRLDFPSKHIQDISPVRALRELRYLDCGGTIADPSQLHDLSPLRGMELEQLTVGSCQVKDLSPLRGMKTLKRLYCNATLIDDLTPLAGLRLESFYFYGTNIQDFSPVRDMPLGSVWIDDRSASHLDFCRSLPTLETINGKPKAEVLERTKENGGK